jgi:hypothetical protein
VLLSFGTYLWKCGSFVENNIRKQGPIEKAFKLKELGKMIKGFVG